MYSIWEKELRLLLLLCLLALSVSSELNNDEEVDADPEMEAYLREALENFRGQMKYGIKAISMPVLDPLELQNIDIQVNENLATMDLKIKKINIEDLSTFKLHKINANLEKLFLKLNLSFPTLQAVGNYTLKGRMLKIFPLHGDGRFSINLTLAEIAGVGKLNISDDFLQIEKLTLDLTWQKMTVFLENFLGGGKFASVLQKVLPNLGKTVFDTYKTDILAKLDSAVQNALNKELLKRTIKDIIGEIVPKSKE